MGANLSTAMSYTLVYLAAEVTPSLSSPCFDKEAYTCLSEFVALGRMRVSKNHISQ